MTKPAIKPKWIVYLDHAIYATLTPIRNELTTLFSDKEDEPILLVISSFGGSGVGMFALMDRIANLRASGAKIHGLVEGYAMSAGLICCNLLQATEHRMIGANATLMAHGISARVAGDLQAIGTELVQLHLDTRRIAKICGKLKASDAVALVANQPPGPQSWSSATSPPHRAVPAQPFGDRQVVVLPGCHDKRERLASAHAAHMQPRCDPLQTHPSRALRRTRTFVQAVATRGGDPR